MQTSMFVAVQSWIFMRLSFLFDTDRSPLYREVWDLTRKNNQLTKELAGASQLLQALQADNEILVGCLEYVKGERDRWFHQCLEASSQLKDKEKRIQTLEILVMRDPDTELLGKNGVIDAWTMLASNLKREQEENIHVLFIDVDRLKLINDTHGHEAGDEALKLVAKMMKGAFRGGDILGRIGGDEFLVIMPHAKKEAALMRADRLKAFLEAACGENEMQVSVSIGITKLALTEDLLTTKKRADAAMYQSKARGRNAVTYTD